MTEEGSQPRVVGYVRVSQERNAANGYGLGAQETDIRRYAEYKRWSIARIYREEGVSGYLKDRPALEHLLADAKAGAFDIVVFPSIDRAGRSVRDVIEIDQALQEAGVVTIFLREGIDTSTATGEFLRIRVSKCISVRCPSMGRVRERTLCKPAPAISAFG